MATNTKQNAVVYEDDVPLQRVQKSANGGSDNTPRKLRVLITIMDGEHRVHLRGEQQDVHEVARASEGFFEQAGTGAGGRDTVFSGPEARVRDVWNAWHRSNSPLVRQAFSQLKREARDEHLRQHPECAELWPQRLT